MTDQPTDTVMLQRGQAERLTSLMRELERFLDDCDETVADALDERFGCRPAAESFSASLSLEADQ